MTKARPSPEPSGTKLVLWALSWLALSVPLAIVVTLLSLPFWSWIERRFAIESVGHSGPAGWCFIETYAFVVVVIGLATRPTS